jgi:hypothetical protein
VPYRHRPETSPGIHFLGLYSDSSQRGVQVFKDSGRYGLESRPSTVEFMFDGEFLTASIPRTSDSSCISW